MKASVKPSPGQPSATTATTEGNHHDGAPPKMKGMDNTSSAKKRPQATSNESDDPSVIASLARPAKKAKVQVDKPAALNRVPVPIRRSGKIILNS